MNPGNKHITDESWHSIVNVDINLADRTLGTQSLVSTMLCTADIVNFASLVRDAATAMGLVFERDAALHWGGPIPRELSDRMVRVLIKQGDCEPTLSDHICTEIALDGRFPLRAVNVLELDDASVRPVLMPGDRHDQQWKGDLEHTSSEGN